MWRSPVSDEVVRSIAPAAGEQVLDLGAGMGAATVVAAGKGARVLAVDPTPYMRQALSLRRLWSSNRSAITVKEGAAEAIPSDDASIDALWTVNTLHHWTNRQAAVLELARVMRPGGRMVLLDEAFDDPSHPEHALSQHSKERHGLEFDKVDVQGLAKELLSAGFARAEGKLETVAGRPAKVVRATR
jgi:ubiquinone/menaquinone biosynthesis C-methylase UbiE